MKNGDGSVVLEGKGGGGNRLTSSECHNTIDFWGQANRSVILPACSSPFQMGSMIQIARTPLIIGGFIYYFISCVLEVAVYRLMLTLITLSQRSDGNDNAFLLDCFQIGPEKSQGQ